MPIAEVKIKNKKERRKHMSDDFICGYLTCISDMFGKLSALKVNFDLEAFWIRAHQKVERKAKRKIKKANQF